MFLEIITPDKKLYSGEIERILVPGSKGRFEVLNNHAAIISTLDTGKIRVVNQENEEIFFDIKSGVIEVKSNNVIVLAETA